MRKILLFVFGVLLISSSCIKNLTVNPDQSISLTLDTVRLISGETKQLLSKNYSPGELNWKSADTAIATVSLNGLVTAKKAGQSLISISNKTNTVSATCLVLVSAPVHVGHIVKIPGNGTDVGIGADSSVFVIGIDDASPTGGHSIYRVVNNALVKMPECAGIRIAVSPAGVPWVINKSNLIYRYNGNTWDLLPGTGTDIGIGADGSVFIIGTVDVSPTGGFNIMKWNGTGWDTLPNCSGTRIAVMPNGIPWVVNKSNIVYRNTGTELWAAVSGVKGNDIGIGAEGSVFVTGKDSTTASYHPHIYKYLSNGNWATINDASGVSIAVSPKGRPWWIDKSNNIFKLND